MSGPAEGRLARPTAGRRTRLEDARIDDLLVTDPGDTNRMAIAETNGPCPSHGGRTTGYAEVLQRRRQRWPAARWYIVDAERERDSSTRNYPPPTDQPSRRGRRLHRRWRSDHPHPLPCRPRPPFHSFALIGRSTLRATLRSTSRIWPLNTAENLETTASPRLKSREQGPDEA